MAGFMGFVHRLEFQITRKTVFRKLDLFRFSGEEKGKVHKPSYTQSWETLWTHNYALEED
jgi:hypothetical protein